MPASLDRVRKTMKVEASPKDKGLVLTVQVVAYDSGMITVDGVPMHHHLTGQDTSGGWLNAAEVTVATLNEFRRQVEERLAGRLSK